LDWIGLDWIGLDWIGLDWIGLDWNDISSTGNSNMQLLKLNFMVLAALHAVNADVCPKPNEVNKYLDASYNAAYYAIHFPSVQVCDGKLECPKISDNADTNGGGCNADDCLSFYACRMVEDSDHHSPEDSMPTKCNQDFFCSMYPLPN
jgi:hypothetical protein